MSTQAKLSLDERLGLNKYDFDEESHIKVDNERCKVCETKPCLNVCPAEVYKLVDGKTVCNHENCIECSTCLIACKTLGKGGIDWYYPKGGFGISYRYG